MASWQARNKSAQWSWNCRSEGRALLDYRTLRAPPETARAGCLSTVQETSRSPSVFGTRDKEHLKNNQ